MLGTLGEQIREALKADDNAAFLATITWDGIRQLVFRVRDPEVANLYLQRLVGDDAIRPMEYQMENDPEWVLAGPHFEHVGRP